MYEEYKNILESIYIESFLSVDEFLLALDIQGIFDGNYPISRENLMGVSEKSTFNICVAEDKVQKVQRQGKFHGYNFRMTMFI